MASPLPRGSLEVECGVLRLRPLLGFLTAVRSLVAVHCCLLTPPQPTPRPGLATGSAAAHCAYDDRRRRPSGVIVAPRRTSKLRAAHEPSLALLPTSNRLRVLPRPSNRPRTVPRPAPGPCGQPLPTPNPRRPPRGSAARGHDPGRDRADRSRPRTRRSSTASSLMGEATRARRRRPRRRIEEATTSSWPRPSCEPWRRSTRSCKKI